MMRKRGLAYIQRLGARSRLMMVWGRAGRRSQPLLPLTGRGHVPLIVGPNELPNRHRPLPSPSWGASSCSLPPCSPSLPLELPVQVRGLEGLAGGGMRKRIWFLLLLPLLPLPSTQQLSPRGTPGLHDPQPLPSPRILSSIRQPLATWLPSWKGFQKTIAQRPFQRVSQKRLLSTPPQKKRLPKFLFNKSSGNHSSWKKVLQKMVSVLREKTIIIYFRDFLHSFGSRSLLGIVLDGENYWGNFNLGCSPRGSSSSNPVTP